MSAEMNSAQIFNVRAGKDYLTLPKKVLTEPTEKSPYRGWKKLITVPEKKVLDIRTPE